MWDYCDVGRAEGPAGRRGVESQQSIINEYSDEFGMNDVVFYLARCWDSLDSSLWWIIKTPIMLSVLVNFGIFVNIIRIIFQKVKDPAVAHGQAPPYRRLLHATLLLAPLFGLHYVIFALFPEHVGVALRLYLELGLGSFQGFMVALLYCFLNGEVRLVFTKI
ncbi:Vasoactive intestinal polypeptide receptor 1 [Merluccius polli]|uniref:Vasoactive intestinal polypeptide receptor 1 n=1 Tax=Merluccius polli TaxID=89951 RepID=A0AA47M7B5_MERPO|nr:Vasoactive intestinal polypeptide receptor 1 [Merluccius polli]